MVIESKKIVNKNMQNIVRYDVTCEFINPCKVSFDEINECPICKKRIKPILKYGEVYKDNNNKNRLVLNYMCNGCFNNFIVQYSECKETSFGIRNFEKIDFVEPNKFEEKIFSRCIEQEFSDFVKIYNQSLKAEHYNLDEIAGMGYRKALEFLIKDFLLLEKQEKQEDIKNWALGKCINELIDNEQLKKVASRATWLGNDQVHYKKIYTENDINDLKLLIEIAIRWIETIFLTNEYEQKIKKINN